MTDKTEQTTDDSRAETAADLITEIIKDGRKAQIDGEIFENHSLPDIIAGLQYINDLKASKSPGGGLRVAKIRGNAAV